MVRYYITIAIMLVIMIFQYRRYRNIIAAPVIYPVMWMLAIFVLTLYKDTFYEISTGTFVIFVAGYVLFCVGFAVACRHRALNDSGEEKEQKEYVDISDQRLGLNVITGICVITGLGFAIFVFGQIDFHDFFTSWVKMRYRMKYEGLEIPYYLLLLRFFIRASLWYISLQFFSIPKENNNCEADGYCPKVDLSIRLLVILVSSVPVMITDLSRNDILFTLLPIIFIYIITKKLSLKRIFGLLLVSLLIFSLFFVYFREIDHGNLFDDGELNTEAAEDSYVHYLCGSLIALDVKLKSGDLKILTSNDGRGIYTISLITSLADRIFGSDNTPYVVRERRSIGPRSTTNVYTVYEWTGMDFGIIYALFWQLIFGVLYGMIYLGILKYKMSSIFWYSALSYSLIMMFFQDQFFSLGQSWLIIIMICYGIFLICNRASLRVRRI